MDSPFPLINIVTLLFTQKKEKYKYDTQKHFISNLIVKLLL